MPRPTTLEVAPHRWPGPRTGRCRRPRRSRGCREPIRPFTMNGMSRRRSSSTSGSESCATERNNTAQSDHDRPRGAESGLSLNGTPRMCWMRSAIHLASSAGSLSSTATRSPRSQVWWPAATIAPSAAVAGPGCAGRRTCRPRRRLARSEVVVEGDLLDALVAFGEPDDVGHLAAAPLVNGLVVVPRRRRGSRRTARGRAQAAPAGRSRPGTRRRRDSGCRTWSWTRP